MQVINIPIEKINPAPYNPRLDLKPGDPLFEKIKRSIEEFDLVDPLVWNKRTGNLVGGHQRLKILKIQGRKEIECSVVDLPLEREKALNLALNKALGDWDEPKLAGLLGELKALADINPEFDLDMTGFDELEVSALMDEYNQAPEEEEATPEPPAEPITKPGEIIELGPHRLMCGDSTKWEDVERLMAGKKADMVFTDPPYGMGGYAGRSGNFEPIKGDNEDIGKFYDCIPNAKERYVWGNWRVLRDTVAEEPRDVIVWVKNNFGMGKGYRGQYELCFYFGNFSDSDSDVWQVDKDAEYKHPTQKPVILAIRAIKNSSRKGDIVSDGFGGSGSTLIACEQTGRICYMMEIDPGYCDVIRERYANYINQPQPKPEAKHKNWADLGKFQ